MLLVDRHLKTTDFSWSFRISTEYFFGRVVLIEKSTSGWSSALYTNIWGPFLESPDTLRAHFGRHNSLSIFKAKASRGTKLWSYFNFYSHYNIKRQALQNQRAAVLGMAFLDFREKGPWPELLRARLALTAMETYRFRYLLTNG